LLKLILKFNLILKKIFKASINSNFTIPDKKEILIFDNSSYILLDILNLNKKKSFLLDVRYNNFYFYFFLKILLRSFFKLKLNGLYRLYLLEVIKHINPKIIVTFIDNNPFFFQLYKSIKAITICVQNAQRFSTEKKIFQRKPKSDFFFCFGDDQKKNFNNIKTNFHTIGSVKNNQFKLKTIKNNKIVFISQLSNTNNFINDNYIKNAPKKWLSKFRNSYNVNFETFYSTELRILPLLALFCEENNYILQIIPRTTATSPHASFEYNFFNNIIGKITKNYSILKKSYWKSSYLHLNRKNTIVCTESTLGIEALRQGLKVLFCSRDFYVGWEDQNPIQFLFKNYENILWTQKETKEKFFNTLKYMINIETTKWNKLLEKKIFPEINKIISYDYKNKKIKKFFKHVLSN